jgi:hypothetical protein
MHPCQSTVIIVRMLPAKVLPTPEKTADDRLSSSGNIINSYSRQVQFSGLQVGPKLFETTWKVKLRSCQKTFGEWRSWAAHGQDSASLWC